jgi:hypothetical protein
MLLLLTLGMYNPAPTVASSPVAASCTHTLPLPLLMLMLLLLPLPPLSLHILRSPIANCGYSVAAAVAALRLLPQLLPLPPRIHVLCHCHCCGYRCTYVCPPSCWLLGLCVPPCTRLSSVCSTCKCIVSILAINCAYLCL